jgi:hypothetical protein
MRRVILALGAMALTLLWSGTASAQFFGIQPKDPQAEIETARKKQQELVQRYARQNAARSRSRLGAARDQYGRMDLSGRPVSGYPSVRGELSGPGASRVSRGGANGPVRRRGRR